MTTIIHLHIPKCGGTSLLNILESNYNVTRLNNRDGWRKFNEGQAQHVTDCLSGHMPYGLHRYFTDYEYITFLRHPLDRLMSFYHYVQSRNGKSIWSKAMDGLNLEEFLHREDLHGNDMVRYIAGKTDISLPKTQTVTKEDLEIAKQHLDSFLFVGDMEDYNQEIKRMGEILGIQVGRIPHKLNTNNPGRHGLSKRLRRSVRPFIELDLELYHYARDL